MGDKTGISWTRGDDGSEGSSWNCLRGCSRVMAEGARQSACGDQTGGGCYAERDGGRFCGTGGPYEGLVRITAKGPRWTGRVDWIKHKVADPLRWQKPRRIFVNSVSDFFHEDLATSRHDVMFCVMALADQHIYQILTKRALQARIWYDGVDFKRMRDNFIYESIDNEDLARTIKHRYRNREQLAAALDRVVCESNWPLPNVHLGASVEHQWAAKERITDLVNCAAQVHWLSCEPLLGELDLELWLEHLQWVVVGCESGPRSRDTKVEWYRSLRDQCGAAGVPLFVKQAREDREAITFGHGSKRKLGDLIEMPYLDGRQHIDQP